MIFPVNVAETTRIKSQVILCILPAPADLFSEYSPSRRIYGMATILYEVLESVLLINNDHNVRLSLQCLQPSLIVNHGHENKIIFLNSDAISFMVIQVLYNRIGCHNVFHPG